MKKIAVGIDFSPESTLAAHQALALARHVGAEVVLVHAQPVVELPQVGPEPEAQVLAAIDTYRSLLARENEESRAKLAELRRSLAGQGAEISQALVEGAPDEAICSASRELEADLLVVGTHGRTGLRWFFLGSVAQRVVRHSPIDVLVARREDAGGGGFRSALVATDFSPASLRALDRALEVVAPSGSIDLVHCLPFRPIGLRRDGVVAWGLELHAALAQSLEAQGQALLAARRRPGGPALEFHLLREPPTPAIVHWLETRPVDLAVLGSHGRTGFRRAVVGSVAEAVVRRAPCSVLVARASAAIASSSP